MLDGNPIDELDVDDLARLRSVDRSIFLRSWLVVLLIGGWQVVVFSDDPPEQFPDLETVLLSLLELGTMASSGHNLKQSSKIRTFQYIQW